MKIKMKLPKGWSNPRIVLGFNKEIRLMCDMSESVHKNWTVKDTAKLRLLKIKYLEIFLGYKIIPMSKIISHKAYEKSLKSMKNYKSLVSEK